MTISSRQSNHRDKKAFLLGATLILFVGFYFIGKSFFWNTEDTLKTNGDVVTDNKKDETPFIAPDILLKKIQSGEKITIVDIRREDAFNSEHIAHSFSLPISSLQNLSPNKDESVVVVFSETDIQTTETAKNILTQKSFPYFFLKGGIDGWKNISAPLISSGDPKSFLDQSKVTYIPLDVFKKILSEKKSPFFILDVQANENYKKKHIIGAVNIPLVELEKRAGEIPAGKPVFVYGENDLASFRGGVRLSDLGIFTAQTLNGDKYLSPDSGLPLEP
ncbi:MAG: rhodanese-like domain-containing protein [Candidatus Moraniibacteriota bacterium]